MKNNLFFFIILISSLISYAQKKELIIETDSIRIYDTYLSKNEKNNLAPTLYNKGILFTSINNAGYSKLYFFDDKNEPQKVRITSKFDLGKVAVFNNEIYFTGNLENGNSTIFKGTIKDLKVKNVKQVSFCKNEFNYAFPSISKDGKTMAIVTNEKGIYHIQILNKSSNGKWIRSETAFITSRNFAIINPTLVDKNTIYYSSNIKKGELQKVVTSVVDGKPVVDELIYEEDSFNIYKITKVNGRWSIPIKVHVFNSEFDDLDVLFIDKKSGYLTTSRFDNNDNIFYFELK